jgi:endonuclease G, mitochondrial
VQQVAHTSSDVWVVTGPLYLPSKTPEGGWVMQHPMLGTPPRMMGVPTHFFKVVLAEPAGRGGKQNVVGAFVMPNSVIDPTTPLASFVVPISALEEVSGASVAIEFDAKTDHCWQLILCVFTDCRSAILP